MKHVIMLTDAELSDLVSAIEDAQNELYCGDGFQEANAQWERWEALIRRFRDGAVAD